MLIMCRYKKKKLVKQERCTFTPTKERKTETRIKKNWKSIAQMLIDSCLWNNI